MYPQVFGKYVLEKELARGGMARVVLATLRGAGGFEKKLVVKQIRDELACDDDFVRRFVDEAKTTVALSHPNIVPVYELGVELGTYFLAMEYVEGASLAEILRACIDGGSAAPAQAGEHAGRGKPISPEEGAYVGVEVCRALDYAHRRMGVVHRDVTPRNVMVDDEGQVKVIDFGISTPVATAPDGQGVFGSPGHMPPEQVAGGKLTPAADVFAVAALLMELWSNKAPFRRHSLDAIDEAMKAPHPRASDADIRLLPLDDVMASAMSLDPAKRPQQAEDLARALRKFLSGVDLGDVARQLGERVKAVRTSPARPAGESKPKLQRPPSRPSAQDIGTRTFAAREEVLPTAEGIGTRRLDSAKPAEAAAAGAEVRAAAEGTRGAADGTKGATEEVETIATRPIESGPREQKAEPALGKKRGVGVVWVATAGAIVLAVGAFYAGKGTGVTGTTPSATTSTATGTATGTTGATASATGSSTSATTASANPTGTSPATGTSTAAPSAAAGSATLMLLGDGTVVSIDGVSRGAAPVRAAIDPGTHAVIFTFPATRESKGMTLSLRAGDRATLRADFTGASPTIRVQR